MGDAGEEGAGFAGRFLVLARNSLTLAALAAFRQESTMRPLLAASLFALSAAAAAANDPVQVIDCEHAVDVRSGKLLGRTVLLVIAGRIADRADSVEALRSSPAYWYSSRPT